MDDTKTASRKSICIHAAPLTGFDGRYHTFEFNNRRPDIVPWTVDAAMHYVQSRGYAVVKVRYN